MRDYDPTLARYLSIDPIGTAGGRNKFGYADTNPQNFVDPLGQQRGRGGPLVVRPTLDQAMLRGRYEALSERIQRQFPNAGYGPTSFRPPGPFEITPAEFARLEQFYINLRSAVSCLPPNPYGSPGGPIHQMTILIRIGELEAQGYRLVAGGPRSEQVVPIPGGGYRRPDIIMTDPQGRLYYENIGDVTLRGEPIARERRALEDLLRANPGRVGFTPKMR
jgi:hypothetical protein